MTTSNLARIPNDWSHRNLSESILVEGIEWHVQISRHANPNAKIILLTHGAGSSAHSWEDILPSLAKHYTVIAPDLPGHGFTLGAKQDQLSTEEVANEIYALLQEIKLLPHILIGHSAGGNVCLDLANSPALPLELVIALNPALVAPPNAYKMFLEPLINPIANSSFMSHFLASTFKMTGSIDQILDSTNSALTPAQRNRYKSLFNESSHIHGALGFVSAIDIPLLLQNSHEIRCPITFVATKQDAWIQMQAVTAVMKESYQHAHIVIEEGGHLFHEEKPGQALEIIRAAINHLQSK